jgi:hypothetical protein
MKDFSNHLKGLISLVNKTTGPILECGGGLYSTPYLHWACYPTGRKLVTLENDPKYFEIIKDFQSDFHEVRLVKDWNIEPGQWSIALIDNNPKETRAGIALQLKDCCDYIVLHDTESRKDKFYGFSKIFPLFKYVKHFDDDSTHVSILSNKEAV